MSEYKRIMRPKDAKEIRDLMVPIFQEDPFMGIPWLYGRCEVCPRTLYKR